MQKDGCNLKNERIVYKKRKEGDQKGKQRGRKKKRRQKVKEKE